MIQSIEYVLPDMGGNNTSLIHMEIVAIIRRMFQDYIENIEDFRFYRKSLS